MSGIRRKSKIISYNQNKRIGSKIQAAKILLLRCQKKLLYITCKNIKELLQIKLMNTVNFVNFKITLEVKITSYFKSKIRLNSK